MDSMQVARVWDGSLRAADWDGARAALADDAKYLGLGGDDEQMTCGTADEIVGLMRSWKGKLPDVEVVNWETFGNQVLAQLRQPAWGDDADWYQVPHRPRRPDHAPRGLPDSRRRGPGVGIVRARHSLARLPTLDRRWRLWRACALRGEPSSRFWTQDQHRSATRCVRDGTQTRRAIARGRAALRVSSCSVIGPPFDLRARCVAGISAARLRSKPLTGHPVASSEGGFHRR
jgi:hypothetical protein